MIGIIIAGESNLVRGIVNAVTERSGVQQDMVAVYDDKDRDEESLNAELRSAIMALRREEGILIFTESADSRTTSIAVKLAEDFVNACRIEVVTGVNLGMAAETAGARIFVRELDSLASLAVENGRKHIEWLTSHDANTAPVRKAE